MRRLGYLALMQRMGVMSLGDERRNYPGPHREIIFLLTAGQDIRQLIWAESHWGLGRKRLTQPAVGSWK